MKIIIDSGHGGKESGAIAFNTKEKDLNIIFASLLADELEGLKHSVDRSLINDKYYSPNELADYINGSGASICVSCHNNAFNGSVRGFEVIHSIHSNGQLAKLVLDEVKKTNFKVRRAFSRKSTVPSNAGENYYYIIRLTYPMVETIIVEFGFMDNYEDFQALNNPEWQRMLTSGVAKGISRYIALNSKTSIIGESILSALQLKRALRAVNKNVDTEIVDIYYQLSKIYGIKADLAFIQSIFEANWLRFTGVVKPRQNNFCGLGATGPDNPGLSFPTMEIGVEAHLQHLFAYASKLPLPSNRKLYDSRFHLVTRGSAPNWQDLNGKWAVPGKDYGERIVALQQRILEKPQPPQQQDHWAQKCHDELREAGLLYNNHSDSLDEAASKGVVFCLINRLRREVAKNE
ncbi:hypothetical protein F8154_07745 [Alkaliphilus pronyensis]|uniref:MurNAc-LAA domain-containing protein n=1 Tax=Alkaliphilus pronyensis TaxID=1482732 RepID=A0A6I0FFZ7_9FIRM|nr:N-acetylmuramoyl-L-alanine amidase [Alkaliphilus pronyensis]KAB3534871.1 hypothetical protein F8154_07745 [Alkaliphilus pronyensis]